MARNTGPQTPAQLAARRANMAKARAAVKHAKGVPQSAAQLAAETANIKKARAARKSSVRKRSARMPLGSHRITGALKHKLTVRKPTGIIRKFRREISPTGFDRRGSWGLARKHHVRKVLKPRKQRTLHVKNWRRRRGHLTPK